MMTLWRQRLSLFRRALYTNRALQQRWGSSTSHSCLCQTCQSLCKSWLRWESSRSTWRSSTRPISSATSLAKITIRLTQTLFAFCSTSMCTEYRTTLPMILKLYRSTSECKKAETTTLPHRDMELEVARLPLLRDIALSLRVQSSCRRLAHSKNSSKWQP